MQLGYKYDVIKNQKFDIGRTINPFMCDCETCEFLHCPKKNYVPKTKPHKYSIKEYIDFHADEIKNGLFAKSESTDDLTDDFMRLFTFPKGTYWRLDYGFGNNRIEIVTFTRSGIEICRGAICRSNGKVADYGFTTAQEKLAARISKGIKAVLDFMEKENAK